MITLFTVAFPQVSIKTREGFVFKGVVRPPDEIVSMRGGDFYADFVANISLESNPIKVGSSQSYSIQSLRLSRFSFMLFFCAFENFFVTFSLYVSVIVPCNR